MGCAETGNWEISEKSSSVRRKGETYKTDEVEDEPTWQSTAISVAWKAVHLVGVEMVYDCTRLVDGFPVVLWDVIKQEGGQERGLVAC